MLISISISIFALAHALGVAAGAEPGQHAPRQAGDDPCAPVCPPRDPSNPDVLTRFAVPCDATCSDFYMCDGERLVLSRCPSGLVFNQEELVCDFPGNYECPPVPDCCDV